MLSIDDYADAAKKAVNTTSDAQLCRELKLSHGVVSFWRVRKAWPSDDVMAKLCDLAEMDPHLGLLYVNWWRAVSRNEDLAATHYKNMILEYEKQAA